MKPAPAVESQQRRRRAVLQFHQLLNDARLDLLEGLVAADYQPHTAKLQHLPRLAAGRAALLQRLRAARRVPHVVKRLVVDGDFAFVHVHYTGPAATAGVDIYRFDGADRIAEHWNLRQPVADSAAAGDWRYSSTLPDDAPQHWTPDALKARVRNMLTQMWMQGDVRLVPEYYAESYVQHNPEMPGGYQRIREVVETNIRGYIDQHGAPFPIEIHHLGAEGQLVFVHLSIFMAGINRNEGVRSTNVDIFLVDNNGRMAEHWDVLQMDNVPLADESSLF
jgi:predicted SnoaL-like aldol condensation-catalyzing enzyme